MFPVVLGDCSGVKLNGCYISWKKKRQKGHGAMDRMELNQRDRRTGKEREIKKDRKRHQERTESEGGRGRGMERE